MGGVRYCGPTESEWFSVKCHNDNCSSGSVIRRIIVPSFHQMAQSSESTLREYSSAEGGNY